MVTEGETQTVPQGLQGHLNTPGTEGAPAQAALTTLELRACREPWGPQSHHQPQHPATDRAANE